MITVVHIIKVVLAAGAERHLLALLPGLRAQGVDVRLLLLVEPGKDMADYTADMGARGVPVERLTIQRHLDPALYRQLENRLREIKPDVVHTHLLHADLYGIPAARRAGVPVVISSRHNDDSFRYRFPIKQVNRLLWRMTDAGIAISEAIRQFSIRVEGAAAEKITTIHYGLAIEPPLDRPAARKQIISELMPTAATDSVLVGIVCRLIEQKGIIYGIRAFARIAEQFPNTRLLIIGQGALRETLEAETKALNVAGRVHFLGWRSDIPAVMAALDLLLMPSLWEGFGLVMLEAMAQATPIIGSAVSAIPEVIVDGETGLLVPPRDVDRLTAALTHLLADKPLRGHMGLMGRDRLETHFSVERMVGETAGLYEKLLKAADRS